MRIFPPAVKKSKLFFGDFFFGLVNNDQPFKISIVFARYVLPHASQTTDYSERLFFHVSSIVFANNSCGKSFFAISYAPVNLLSNGKRDIMRAI